MAKQSHTGIAVLESRWYQRSNVSVRGMFDLIAYNNHEENADAYHYEMINSRAAFREALPRLAADRTLKVLYLGTHGREGTLKLGNGDVIEPKEIKCLLMNVRRQKGAKLHGLYLSVCSSGVSELAQSVLDSSTSIQWVAGYKGDVDWLDGLALDMIFFNHLADYDIGSPASISKMCKELESVAGKLIESLTFRVYIRGKGAMFDAFSN